MNNVEYTALAGKVASTNKLKVVSNNAANASTSGFKGDDVLFQKWLHYDFNKDNSMPVDAKTITNYVQGNLQQTNNKFDFAIIGTGFFGVIEENGNRKFTRNGKFTLNSEGILKDMNGRSISDVDGGEINVGQEYASFDVLKDGRIFVNGAEAGTIGIFEFAQDEVVLKGRYGDFIINGEPTPVDITKTSLIQGMIEGSNVDPILGLLELTETNKQVESNNLVINTNRENIRSTYKIFSKSND
ncbi:MAG: flagellar hook-basal body complex protein [Candidatus Midichloria sp.]|nr:flagellar hook-basal body complex protein [Candidatus Midichloria sp.]